MPPPTDKPSVVAAYIKDMLEQSAIPFEDVWYGDQNLIPRTPAAAVEPGARGREWAGTSRSSMNTFVVDVIIYHSQLEDVNLTRQEALELAEDVEVLLHSDPTLGGLVIDSLCTSLEPGYAERGNILLQATSVRWEGRSKTRVI